MFAVCALVKRNEKILLCKRENGSLYPGFWELPMGEAEENELLEDALERALFDRLTVRSRVARPLASVDMEEILGVRLFGYSVSLFNNFLHPYGYSAFKWVKIKELHKFRLLKSCVTIIKCLEKKI